MPQTKLAHPTYAEQFRCIGPTCEDTCCQGWNVAIDREAYEKYQKLPVGPLRQLLNEVVQVQPTSIERTKPASFAIIPISGAGQCPMLNEERLCSIQAEHGEALLSHVCATYPRVKHQIGGIEEIALTLSCPEAARLILLSKNLLAVEASTPGAVSRQAGEDDPSAPPDFWPIRAVVLALVRNRAYSLWQRIFLLGLLCRRLDSITKGELKRSVPDFLVDFDAAVTTGALRPSLATLPIDRAAQLDAVLRLSGMLLHRANVQPRFVACIEAFTAGIGNGPEATLQSLTEHYTLAHDRYYAPFLDRHPQIVENYLINTILRRQFPFGAEAMLSNVPASMTKEFTKLIAQFTLMKGLLIGVAGFHRESFSAEHVVHTVQAASKHFEHHPEFLDLAHTLLVESQLDGARGMAVLLRNHESRHPQPAAPRIHVPEPQPDAQA